MALAGSTRVWTFDGPSPLEALAGSRPTMLLAGGNGARWRQVDVKALAPQPAIAVTIARGQSRLTDVIEASPDHQFLVREHRDKPHACTSLRASELRAGDWLRYQLPRPLGQTQPSPYGIAAGLVFGDGTRQRFHCRLDLWGGKVELLRHFPTEMPRRPIGPTANGVDGVMLLNLPLSFKDRPRWEDGHATILGWLAGYLASDGCVTTDGFCTLRSIHREDLEFVRLMCARVGIASSMRATTLNGDGSYSPGSELHTLRLERGPMLERTLLRQLHRERYSSTVSARYLGWRVVDVRPLSEPQPMFVVATAPDEHVVHEEWIALGGGTSTTAASPVTTVRAA